MAAPKPAQGGTRVRRDFPGRVARGLRYRASKQYAFLDLGSSSASTVLVAGTQRSGTTWLAEEVLNHDNRYRMIFEPLHEFGSKVVPRGMVWAHYLDPGDESVQFRDAIDAIVRGSVRSPRTDRANHKRLARRRIIKCVNATNLLPWLRRWHPRMTTVFVVRHPFAVAHSLCRMGWHNFRPTPGEADVDRVLATSGLLDGPLRDRRAAVLDLRAKCGENIFTLLVLRWCLENYVALRMLEPSALHHVLSYERLVRDPGSELAPLVRAGIMTDAPAERFDRPSRTDFQQRVEGARADPGGDLALIAPWQQESPGDLRLGMTILETFGLDHFYGLDPLPHDTPGNW